MKSCSSWLPKGTSLGGNGIWPAFGLGRLNVSGGGYVIINNGPPNGSVPASRQTDCLVRGWSARTDNQSLPDDLDPILRRFLKTHAVLPDTVDTARLANATEIFGEYGFQVVTAFGPRVVRGRIVPDAIESVCGSIVVAVEEVPIGIECRLD